MPDLTREQIEEITACRMDPLRFFPYGKVKHPIRGILPFQLYNFQENVIKKMLEHRFNIVLKSRQMGLSTLLAAYAVWYASFFPAKQILILANKGKVASNFIKKCKLFHATCPSWLVPKATNDNMMSLDLENKSEITSSSTTVDSARSEAISLLILDECLGAFSKIKIKNKITGEIKEEQIGNLYKFNEYR